ncbi:MAG: hypothetical protein K9H61_11745 [Bacteroidia bacterium]|nr:hypothetical protein [Bacteroidia bacterium]MCF8447660.1 hypothetical protein [Bacteroidia bacterium]
MKTKILILTILSTTLFSCSNNNNKEMCLKYSTSFINKETQRLVNRINDYNNLNTKDQKGIECKIKLEKIEDGYVKLSKIIKSTDNIELSRIAMEDFYSLVKNYLVGNKYADSLHLLVLNSNYEILNIVSLIRYEALNNLISDFYSTLDVVYYLDYNYYAIADTIKLSEAFKGFVTYEISRYTKNNEYKDYKILSAKRNGKAVDKLDIQLASNNRLFIVKPEQIGNYEINLEYRRSSNLHPYTKSYPLQIKFMVVE